MNHLVYLHLRINVQDRTRLIEFLRQAVPLYEKPGGIRIRLLQNFEKPNSFLEVVEYRDRPSYEQDQRRVKFDPEFKSCLQAWHRVLAGPPTAESYLDVTEELHG